MGTVKYYFCSFADFSLLPSLLRIKKQAEKMKVFAECEIFTQYSLTRRARKNVKAIIKKSHSKRGFGYWSWKPDIINQMFSRMNDDDILLYCDAGCELNCNGRTKLSYYFDLASKKDICAVQLPDSMSDINYTKIDALKFFKNLSIEEMKKGQVQATAFLMKKSVFTKEFVHKWCELMSVENIHLFDDSESMEPENPDFVSHRHDQSIFSCLLKASHFESLPIENFWAEEGKWESLYHTEPVLFKRNKVTIVGCVKGTVHSFLKTIKRKLFEYSEISK